MESPNSDTETVVALERELQTPTTRSNPARLDELLAPNFVEIGASGKRWTKDSILNMLAEDDDLVITMTNVEARALTEDVIQILWESEMGGNRAKRSSLWQRFPAGWQLVFHQGTPYNK